MSAANVFCVCVCGMPEPFTKRDMNKRIEVFSFHRLSKTNFYVSIGERDSIELKRHPFVSERSLVFLFI